MSAPLKRFGWNETFKDLFEEYISKYVFFRPIDVLNYDQNSFTNKLFSSELPRLFQIYHIKIKAYILYFENELP